MTNRATVVEFLPIWLKKCIVPTLEVIAIGAILPAVHLAHGVHIALVPAVIAIIESRLRQVTTGFLGSLSKTPMVRLTYTYLVAWYIFHFPTLMTLKPLIGALEPFVQTLQSHGLPLRC